MSEPDPENEPPLGGTPPCYLHEIVEPRRAEEAPPVDLARWRRGERERLIALRMALPAEVRSAVAEGIARELDRTVARAGGGIVSVYWPIRGEPDLRPWMREASAQGLRIALPVAVALNQPLKFRVWLPGARMSHGLLKIPYPADGAEVQPTTVLAPLVGFDAGCFRLGYGGGFFDRTLAGFEHKPLAIGVGYAQTRLPTIFPQTHDIPMDRILLGSGPAIRRS